MTTACPDGMKRSVRDSHHRCIKSLSRSSCAKLNKEYNSVTNRCRIPCKNNESRDGTRDRCRLKCKSGSERGTRTCRKKCKKNEVRRQTGKCGRKK